MRSMVACSSRQTEGRMNGEKLNGRRLDTKKDKWLETKRRKADGWKAGWRSERYMAGRLDGSRKDIWPEG